VTTAARPDVAAALALHADTRRVVLPNGLTLLVRRDASAPVVAIVTHVRAGYFDEPDELVGIAHVLEHMFFKGTPTRGVGQIARETKAHGGSLNAHTIYDHTSYYTVLPASAFVQGLEIQFDAWANAVIDADELARELEVIVQEARRKRDTPGAVAIESLYALLHDRHRIRRWRIGEEAGLRALTREHLLAFYRHWYRPANTILAIVGDVDPDAVEREVAARHGTLAGGAPERTPGPVETGPPGFRLREWDGDIQQQQLAFGWRVPEAAHPDAPALDLAGVALGTGRASRLYRAVRERQLATGVSAWNYTAGDVGVFVVHAESPPAQAREAAFQAWREVQAARRHGLRPSEIVRARRITEARWLRRLETMDGQASYLAAWEAEGGLERATTYYDRLLSLDAGAVQAAMQRHLDPEQASVASYRPAGAAPLADDAASLRAALQQLEAEGSTVLPSPASSHEAPQEPPAAAPEGVVATAAGVASPGIATGLTRERVDHGVHVYRTAGGVPLLVLPRPGTPLVNVGVFQQGGTCLEPAGREGLARLMAQSALKGTARESGPRIAERAEALGSSIGVSAALESVGWTMSVPVRHLGDAVALLADVVLRPTFPDEGVETERQLALAEVARLRDDMYRWPLRLATAAAYGTHPYARSVLGTEASLAALDAAAVRAHHAAHVLEGATVLAVVGDVAPDAVAALVGSAFGGLAWSGRPAPPATEWPRSSIQLAEPRDKRQTALALLFSGPTRRDEARFAARVLSAVASGLGGRFFEQLRDRQSLAYTVAVFPVERRAGGSLAAYIATAPEREEEARAGLLREFARLVEAPPSDEELERARRYLIGTHAIGQQSGGAVLADVVDAWLFGEGLHELRDVPERIARVGAADVLALARRHVDPDRRVEGVVRGSRPPAAAR
jgi:zinc protease